MVALSSVFGTTATNLTVFVAPYNELAKYFIWMHIHHTWIPTQLLMNIPRDHNGSCNFRSFISANKYKKGKVI